MGYKDLTNQRFGRLIAIEPIGSNHSRTMMWNCRCDCGREVTKSAKGLISGDTKSCGCLWKESMSNSHTTHNKTNTRLYRIYTGMRQRCLNSKSDNYYLYGGRGITICHEWLSDFDSFYNWSISHGYDGKLSIDRINVNGNYEPGNCRWVTSRTQINNRRNTILIEYGGKTLPLSEWSDVLNISYSTLQFRLNSGWSTEKTFTSGTLLTMQFNGEEHTIAEWANITGLSEQTIRNRIGKGWTIEKILTHPYKSIKVGGN